MRLSVRRPAWVIICKDEDGGALLKGGLPDELSSEFEKSGDCQTDYSFVVNCRLGVFFGRLCFRGDYGKLAAVFRQEKRLFMS